MLYEVITNIFKAIIAVTLGLAIYDLAKTILENEVMYRITSYNVCYTKLLRWD